MSETGALSVSGLNLMIADALRKEPRLRMVTVRGEVSGFRHYAASGHWYFSLKDTEAAISCVMFRQNTFRAKLRPKDGDSVVLSGYVDVYPKNGNCQLYVASLRADGIGEMYIRFEELKRKLSAEGLLDPSRKRLLPMMPRKVAVVTSISGAAVHDILNVSGMRCPFVPIVLIPVTVQGERAAAEIASGIRAANENTDADVLIVARGGGSAEDLWCFNEEIVARAVAGSRIPVVSGVGHETDITLCDLAADMRASTPSNASEIVFPDRKELRSHAEQLRSGLLKAAEAATSRGWDKVSRAVIRLSALSPEKQIAGLMSRSELGRERLNHAISGRTESARLSLSAAEEKLAGAAVKRTERISQLLIRYGERLEAISPLRVLDRGYALVMNEQGALVSGKEEALQAENVSIRFRDGSVKAVIRKGKGE